MPERRTLSGDELGSCDANSLIEVALCAWHLFHYLPFPTYNVMTSLFLLPKGSNFHFRQHISYIPLVIMDNLMISPCSLYKGILLSFKQKCQTLVSLPCKQETCGQSSAQQSGIAHLTWQRNWSGL